MHDILTVIAASTSLPAVPVTMEVSSRSCFSLIVAPEECHEGLQLCSREHTLQGHWGREGRGGGGRVGERGEGGGGRVGERGEGGSGGERGGGEWGKEGRGEWGREGRGE